jgi:hypothetical protein
MKRTAARTSCPKRAYSLVRLQRGHEWPLFHGRTKLRIWAPHHCRVLRGRACPERSRRAGDFDLPNQSDRVKIPALSLQTVVCSNSNVGALLFPGFGDPAKAILMSSRTRSARRDLNPERSSSAVWQRHEVHLATPDYSPATHRRSSARIVRSLSRFRELGMTPSSGTERSGRTLP